MKVQLLTFADCPNAAPARDALRQAIREERLDVAIEEVDIGAPDAPAALRAWGSPTILIDGTDVLGATPAEGEIGCRLYPGGSPSVAQIRARLRGGTPGYRSSRGGAPLFGALVAAIAASACCIVPAVLAVVGLSGAGIAAMLAPLRPYFLGATALALGGGLWLAYRRPRSCAVACGCPAPRTRTLARLSLWLGVVVALGIAAYPWLLDGRTSASGEVRRGVAELRFHVDGMDCRGCTTKLVRTLSRVRGVATAEVDYDARLAIVTHDGTRDPTRDLLDAIETLGYRGTPLAGRGAQATVR